MAVSLASILAESALRYPARTALVLGEQRLNYAQLWEDARRYASVFAARGITAGQRVAIMLPNVADFPRAYYGALILGATVVPVHLLLLESEVEYVLRDSEATLMICAPSFPEGLKGARQAGVACLELPDLHELAKHVDPVETYVQRDAFDDAVILYTSGTTGQPKGAVLSNYNLSMNCAIIVSDLFHFVKDDVILGCLPLFHSFGQTVVMNAAFRAGACVVLMPRFDGPGALELLVRDKVTIFAGVPTMYIALLEAAKHDTRRPAMRVAVAGGSSLLLAVLEEFERVFKTLIYEGYGLSETSPVASFNQDDFGRKPGTVGCGIWGVDLRVAKAELDDRIEFVPNGEIGEIVIRGHCVFKGYLNRPDATAAAIIDGWFRSGDLGTQDDESFITIVDRKKDMVLRGGFNVYPREVEEVLVRHPAVAQIAVIGLPDATHGEEIAAIVVRDLGAQGVSAAEIIEWSKDHLARYKYPRIVHFVDALPLGPSGKVLKRALVKRFS